jgi:hypothetical protein
MDVPRNKKLEGQDLVNSVVSLTGLPEEEMYKELEQILESSGHQSSELTMDSLRAAMIAYLEETMALEAEANPSAS